jgi:hypothetical protein
LFNLTAGKSKREYKFGFFITFFWNNSWVGFFKLFQIDFGVDAQKYYAIRVCIGIEAAQIVVVL